MSAAYPPWGMRGPQAIAWWALRTQTTDVRVHGLEHVPATGPVMLVARHYHHLLDGAVLVNRLARPVHIIVGLDWAPDRTTRRIMEAACRAADFPVVLRPRTIRGAAAYAPQEVVRFTRGALRDATRLLVAGRVVLLFPEGYPTIDPQGSLKADDDAFLPFAQGLGAIATRARAAGVNLAIVPVGFSYTRAERERWSIVARIGAPLPGDTPVNVIERTVHELSQR